MPRNITTYAGTLHFWNQLIRALAANPEAMPYLNHKRAELEALLAEAHEIVSEQALLAARRQEASKRLEALIAEGRRVTHFLQVGIKENYGNRAEKLVEFGLRPFRGRKIARPEAPVEQAS
jgi:hypothetical protein